MASLSIQEAVSYAQTHPSYEPVKIFNGRIQNMVAKDSWIFSAAALGAIEYCYITASKNIHNYAKHFLSADKITHYSLHETMDVKHATDLFSIIEERWGEDKDHIISGLQFGYFCLDELYLGTSKFLLSPPHIQ
jgi:pyrroloquinoline-quinone synthase